MNEGRMYPDAVTLLRGVEAFLGRDLAGQIADRGLAFRVRISAYLIGMVARELSQELASPSDLAALVARIQDPSTTEADLRALATSLRLDLHDELAVVQPRFDVALKIEREETEGEQ